VRKEPLGTGEWCVIACIKSENMGPQCRFQQSNVQPQFRDVHLNTVQSLL
jgi:hypothetical protein